LLDNSLFRGNLSDYLREVWGILPHLWSSSNTTWFKPLTLVPGTVVAAMLDDEIIMQTLLAIKDGRHQGKCNSYTVPAFAKSDRIAISITCVLCSNH